MAKADESIWRGELECYNYLLKITGTKDGQNAFLGELPAVTEAFMFSVNGGPDPSYADGTHESSFGSWLLAGEMIAVFKDRKDAMLLWGKMLEGLPAGLNHSRNASNFNCTQVFRLDGMPNLTVDYRELANGGKGKVYRMWLLTAAFQIVVNNV